MEYARGHRAEIGAAMCPVRHRCVSAVVQTVGRPPESGAPADGSLVPSDSCRPTLAARVVFHPDCIRAKADRRRPVGEHPGAGRHSDDRDDRFRARHARLDRGFGQAVARSLAGSRGLTGEQSRLDESLQSAGENI